MDFDHMNDVIYGFLLSALLDLLPACTHITIVLISFFPASEIKMLFILQRRAF